MNKHFKRALFIFSILLISTIFSYKLFYDLYVSTTVVIPYGLTEFDIFTTNPLAWKYIKFFYIIFFILSNIICSNALFSFLPILPHQKKHFSSSSLNFTDSFNIFIGTTLEDEPVYITENGLYQNVLITGTIRYWKKLFCYVSNYKTTYNAKSHKYSKKTSTISVRCKRKLS